jgi:hypothetical protein
VELRDSGAAGLARSFMISTHWRGVRNLNQQKKLCNAVTDFFVVGAAASPAKKYVTSTRNDSAPKSC